MEHSPPQFFRRGPAPLARLTFFGLLSILLMVLDARFRYAEPLRQTIAIAVYPIQQIVIAPVTAVMSMSDFFTTQARLRHENAALRTEQLRAAHELLTLESLRAENEQLRQILDAKGKLPSDAIFAELVYAGRDPFSRKVIIDKGSQQGVEAGQPVIQTHGVVGQITRVQPLLAEVTLITDKDHAIPVQVLRNGLRGVAYGAGDGATLELRYMASNAEIAEGDVLVTSGLDGIYPRGLPVATVTKIERDASYAFAKIACEPIAATEQFQQVLVLAKNADAPSWTATTEPRIKRSSRTKRGRPSE